MNSAVKTTYDFFCFTKGQPIPLTMTSALQYEGLLFESNYQLSLISSIEKVSTLLTVANMIKESGFPEIQGNQNRLKNPIELFDFHEVLRDFLPEIKGLTDQDISEISKAFHIVAERLTENLKEQLHHNTINNEHNIKLATGEMRTRYKKSDHAVVTDFSSDKGYRAITKIKWEKEYPKMKPAFFGSEKECQRWVDALTPEGRKEVELAVLREFKERVPLPSENKIAKENDEQVNNVLKKFNLPVQQPLFGDSNKNKGLNLER